MRRRVEGDGCQTNIWLVTEWLTSGHMQSSNHVYGLQKAVDDDWLICKAVWHLYLKPTPKHVPLSLSNLLRLLPCVLSYNIQIHVCLVFYYVFFFLCSLHKRKEGSWSISGWGFVGFKHRMRQFIQISKRVWYLPWPADERYLSVEGKCPGDPDCLHLWQTGNWKHTNTQTHTQLPSGVLYLMHKYWCSTWWWGQIAHDQKHILLNINWVFLWPSLLIEQEAFNEYWYRVLRHLYR